MIILSRQAGTNIGKTQKQTVFLQVTPTNWALPVKGAQEQANRIQCYTESDGPDYLKANWSLPRPIGLNTSFGYQPDSHVAFRYANIWLAFTNTFNPSQIGSCTINANPIVHFLVFLRKERRGCV